MNEISITQPQLGFVFEYAKRLTGFEFKNSAQQSKKVVVFIAGLTDGLLTVPYLPRLLQELDSVGWTLVQVIITSSYSGWGTGSLARDLDEISKLVLYLRSDRGGLRDKVVLMGHSTGCQDTMEYLTKLPKSPEYSIDGAILQAPVSDRESILHSIPLDKLDKLNNTAKRFVLEKRSNEVLPLEFSKVFLGAPLSAYRWLSFTQKGGHDDYFSSDLSLEVVQDNFSKVDKPLLVLYSGEDEYVPEFVNKQELIDTWKQYTKQWSPYSKVVPHATHAISSPAAQEDLCRSVSLFLRSV